MLARLILAASLLKSVVVYQTVLAFTSCARLVLVLELLALLVLVVVTVSLVVLVVVGCSGTKASGVKVIAPAPIRAGHLPKTAATEFSIASRKDVP